MVYGKSARQMRKKQQRISLTCIGAIAMAVAVYFALRSDEPPQRDANKIIGRIVEPLPGSGEIAHGPLPTLRDPDEIFKVTFKQLTAQLAHKGPNIIVDGISGPEIWGTTAEALLISPADCKLFNSVLKESQRELQKLERANLEVVNQTDSELKLKIKPFPEAGAAIKMRIDNEIERIGGEDSKELAALLRPSLETRFREFGRVERNITGRVTSAGYNEVIEDGVTRGFPFPLSFDSMQQHLFRFEEMK